MALSELDQIKKLVADHQYFLIVWPPHDTGDALASALALKSWLKGRGKQVEVAADGFAPAPEWRWLPGVAEVLPRLSEIQKFIIKVDTTKAPLETISYDVKAGWLSIYLTPKQGVITKNELRTAQSTFKYQAIIVVGATDLPALGEIFFNNTDLFYRLPLLALGRSAAHERFGAVNWIDLTMSSLSELTARLLTALGDEPLNGTLPTCLLAGLIAATKRFTAPGVTPATLQLASTLIAAGADREQIIGQLFRTRSLPTLKLWGAALSQVGFDREDGVVFTTLTGEDFKRAGATTSALPALAEELLSAAPEAKLVLILAELPGAEDVVQGLLMSPNGASVKTLITPLHPDGSASQPTFLLSGHSLPQALEVCLATIRNALEQPPTAYRTA